MEFSIKACDWTEEANNTFLNGKYDCLVVGVFTDQKQLSNLSALVNHASQNLLSRMLKTGGFKEDVGATLMLYEALANGKTHLLLVNLGKREDFNHKVFLKVARAAYQTLAARQLTQVVWTLAQQPINDRSPAWAVHHSIMLARAATYQFTQLKSESKANLLAQAKVTLTVDTITEKVSKVALKQGVALANGVDLTRDLANLPGNICTPTYLADEAERLARELELKVKVLSQKQIEALKMGSFLSVAKGSTEPPKFIILEYLGAAAKAAPIVLVGKGITFDSGGISLKPGEHMDEMKYDMCGAASVLGTLRAVAEMKLKLNLIVVIPTCENMPAGNANKPGDIVTSMSGQTIEVLNTDAEGRLILCDALTYVSRFKPAAVIDIATLTGACVIALGHHRSGLYARDKDDALANELLTAANHADDLAWRMPLDSEYTEQLKSNFADLGNIGGRPAGSVTAACFLERFTKSYPWAHLDIAGTAWKSGQHKGATGRPVALLTQFLINRAGQNLD